MPTLYGRRIEVEIAGLLISEPRISVEIERQIDSSQDKGEVAIFNLRNENADRIFKRGGAVRISAGYPETVAVIFEGEAQRIRRAREGLAFVTRIQLGDRVNEVQKLSGSYNRSWAGHASVREIAVSIISEGLGLLAGPSHRRRGGAAASRARQVRAAVANRRRPLARGRSTRGPG